MKKIYYSPKVIVVRVEQHLMQAGGSKTLGGNEGKSSFSVMFSDDEYGGEAASRRGGGWGDED